MPRYFKVVVNTQDVYTELAKVECEITPTLAKEYLGKKVFKKFSKKAEVNPRFHALVFEKSVRKRDNAEAVPVFVYAIFIVGDLGSGVIEIDLDKDLTVNIERFIQTKYSMNYLPDAE